MIKTQILIEGNIRSKVRVKVKVRFTLFYSELLPPFPLTRDVACSRLYLDEKNMRRQCQINTL